MLASGRDVNVLVLDTEVYSNTGGQMSKATPLGAVAKFAAAGKTMPTKDLALQAIALANVYVARVAMGADPQQTLTAFREAEAYDGPSLIIAYSHCIAHGYDMSDGLDQQYRAVASGHWPLIRYDPVVRAERGNPFLLDSPRPRMRWPTTARASCASARWRNADPAEAERLLDAGRSRRSTSAGRLTRRWPPRSAEDFPADPAGTRLMDLATGYMGLRLRNPLVASPSPLSYTVEGVQRLADVGRRRDRAVLAVRGAAARAGRRTSPSSSTARPRASPRRSTTCPPCAKEDPGPRTLPAACSSGPTASRGHPGDRQPQRRDARGLDRLRARHAAGRRRRPSS